MESEEEKIDVLNHPNVRFEEDGSAVLALENPYPWGKGEMITEITIRRPKFKDTKAAKGKDELSRISSLMSLLTEKAQAEIDELDMYDLNVAAAIIEFFTTKSRKTGGSGSGLLRDT